MLKPNMSKYGGKMTTANSLDLDVMWTNAQLDINIAGGALVAEVSTVVAEDEATNDYDGTYFTLDTPAEDYYVWFNLDSGSTDPEVSARTGIEVAVTSSDAAQTVSDAIKAAVTAEAAFSAANGSGTSTTVTITNATGGDAPNIAAGTSDLVVATTQEGLDNAVHVSVPFGARDIAEILDVIVEDVAGDADVTVLYNAIDGELKRMVFTDLVNLGS